MQVPRWAAGAKVGTAEPLMLSARFMWPWRAMHMPCLQPLG
jgi:hypothetical protein